MVPFWRRAYLAGTCYPIAVVPSSSWLPVPLSSWLGVHHLKHPPLIACMYCPVLSSGLPKFRGFDLRSNPDFPNTAAWFAAISARPAYQKVCSDDQTLQLLFQRMMGMTAGAAAASTKTAAAAAAAAIAAFAQSGSVTEHEALTAEQEQKARTEVRLHALRVDGWV